MSTVKRFLWTLRLRQSGAILDKLALQRAAFRLDRPSLEAMQEERLADLLRWSHAHVPYYRSTLERHGVIRGGSLDLDRFREVPPLDKATIRAQGIDMHADDLERRDHWTNTSGGSTGEPVELVQDREYHEWKLATKMLFNEWAGHRPGDSTVFLWGAQRDVSTTETLRGRIGGWLRNEVVLDAFHMPAGTMRTYVERINRLRPKLVVAYAQSLFELARFVERENLRVWSPTGIITSATTLHHHMREVIERVFGTRVLDRYGSREVGDIACERPGVPGLSIAASTHYVEILRPDGSPADVGQPGEIVVTLLTNRAMPLIRYRIGDVGVFAPDDVEGAGPRLAQVSGRVTDVFPTLAGGTVYGGYFTRLLYGLPWVREFQVVQEALDHVRVSVVPREPESEVPPGDLRGLTAGIVDVMGPECKVDIEFVSAIHRPASGKRRYTWSKVVDARDDPGGLETGP